MKMQNCVVVVYQLHLKYTWMSGHSYGEIPRFVEELAYLRGLNVRNNSWTSIVKSIKEKI